MLVVYIIMIEMTIEPKGTRKTISMRIMEMYGNVFIKNAVKKN